MKSIKPRNLKFTLCAFGLVLPLALTSCGNSVTKEKILVPHQIEYKKGTFQNYYEMLDTQSSEYSEALKTLDSIVGLTYDISPYSEKIETVNINGRISEEDFVIALNCLYKYCCDDLFKLDINSVDLSLWSDETQQLFKDTINSMKKLGILQIRNIKISDVSFLSDAQFKESLKLLTLQNDNITDIDVLSDFIALESIFLDNNNIENVEPLGSLDNLETLQISNNNISDISIFLDSCPRLDTLNVRYNCISDFSAGEKLQSFGIYVYGLSKNLQKDIIIYSIKPL